MSSEEIARAPTRLHSLQALRLIAVMGVMFHHTMTSFEPLTNIQIGAAGVDVFFVISGVVIGYIDHDDGVGAFALKRLIRIVPLYWLATFAFAGLHFIASGQIPSAETLLRSLFLIPESARGWTPIYYPGLTLCSELSFYALFGALLFLVRGRATVITACLAIIIALSHIPAPFGDGYNFDTTPFLLFGVGLLMAEFLSRGGAIPALLGPPLIAMAIVGFALSPQDTAPRVLHWGIPAILLVFGFLALERQSWMRSKILALGGDASYSLYLFHLVPMEILLYGIAPRLGLELSGDPWAVTLRLVLLIGSALVTGIAVHLWIEKPLLRSLRKLTRIRQ